MGHAPREVRVRPGVVIPAAALEIRFARSGGPGGQNVNKVETKAEVRFDLRGATLFAPADHARAVERLATRLTGEGVLVVACDRTRHRERNLREALERMGELLREAMRPPRVRRPTRPGRAARERRLDEKRRRSAVKAARRRDPDPG